MIIIVVYGCKYWDLPKKKNLNDKKNLKIMRFKMINFKLKIKQEIRLDVLQVG
jgi:hypothetical protein